jgi:dihydroflavonol-4-reductase
MAGSNGTVLVTGGTGFLGGWCIARLLEQGYDVRTTVRSLGREQAVRETVAKAGVDAGSDLTIAAADLMSDDGWSDVVAGCRFVLHVASPFPPEQPKDPDELIVPAREGAVRVLRAALDAGTERVVLTSSVAAVRGSRTSSLNSPYTEADWTDGSDPTRTPYVRSKTLAERAAWAVVEERNATDRLAVINPGAIIGPTLNNDRSTSLQAVERVLTGMPMAPRLGFTFVDVRDVADLHIKAMTDPAAAGERFIAADQWLWVIDIARIVRARLGDAGAKAPTRVAPDFVIRLMARFDSGLRSVVGDLGKQAWTSSEKARTMLGWSPMPIESSVEDTARSLL